LAIRRHGQQLRAARMAAGDAGMPTRGTPKEGPRGGTPRQDPPLWKQTHDRSERHAAELTLPGPSAKI
ncbi:MAG: hypothetical protein Q8R78_06795, partial [Candidatus Omnitrophota bacterium]|nr:hypothetical protein [Candidatus Omnitrophota bacterium]